MFEVVVMEVDTREVHEVRVVSRAEAMAIAKGYANDPFYTVVMTAVQARIKERKVTNMEKQTMMELLETLIAGAKESRDFILENDITVPAEFYEGKISAYGLVLDLMREQQ